MFYIFHGEDDHKKNETLTQLLGRLGDQGMLDLNTTRFSGQVSLSDLRQAVDTIPFLAPARVVIVDDLFVTNPGKAYMEELLSFLPKVPDSTRLLFLESQVLRGNHPVITLANRDEQGLERSFPLPEGNQVDRWILRQAQKKGGEVSPRAAHLLASIIGNDLHILDNELEKLVVYKASATTKTIEEDDVTLLSPYFAEASIFDLVDALGNRNEREASILYQRKLNEGVDPFYLFSMFVRQFRLLIQVKELAEDGYSPPAIARELRLHEFVTNKIYGQARGFTLTELELVFRHLLHVDVRVKTGKADLQTELDLLIAKLTEAG